MTYEVGPLDVPAVDEGEEEEAGGGQQPLRLVWRLALGEERLQHTQQHLQLFRNSEKGVERGRKVKRSETKKIKERNTWLNLPFQLI